MSDATQQTSSWQRKLGWVSLDPMQVTDAASLWVGDVPSWHEDPLGKKAEPILLMLNEAIDKGKLAAREYHFRGKLLRYVGRNDLRRLCVAESLDTPHFLTIG